MNLYLARHTETNYNVSGLSNSDPKVAVYLTEHGVKQAQALAKKLEDTDLDVIITSRLPRTIQTANIINGARNIPLVSDQRLNDINMGYEGKPVSNYRTALANQPDIWTAKFNDGESLQDVRLRVNGFLDWLKAAPYKNVLIISHLTILQLMQSRLEHTDEVRAFDLEIPQGDYYSASL
jgi:alpha-ribazole phosphatase